MKYVIENAGPGLWYVRTYTRDKFGPRPGQVVEVCRGRPEAVAALRRRTAISERPHG